MSSTPRPRHVFRVAILCALPLEAGMVKAVFDRLDTGHDFGQAEEDRNSYTTGVIGKHNVVLVHMAGMGSTDAATAVTGLRATFPNIDIVFVVGICGASPTNMAREEICLGDCILSTALIQYDFGRQYPGHFDRKTEVEDSLGRAKPEIRALLSRLQALGTPQAIEGQLVQHLRVLQEKEPKARCPGPGKDHLFDPAYLHIHRDATGKCDKCVDGSEVCTKDCAEIGCDEARLIPRTTLATDQRTPRLHFGRYGSANTVLKSGADRDGYIKTDKIVAFEMEAAGVWESLPTLVVKSACDYADSHKNKEWQGYAAATAAAGLKAILDYWRLVDTSRRSDQAVAIPIISHLSNSTDEADRLLRDYYRSGDHLLIKRLSGQELDLEKCYINLSLVDRTQGNRKEQQSFSLKDRLRLGAAKADQNIPLGDLFKSRELANGKTVEPRRIYIQGRAGIGKTTLCKKLVHEFLGGQLGSNLFRRLMWIPLRGLRPSQDEYRWHELLRDTFRADSQTGKAIENVQQSDTNLFLGQTLFLFDGLDEISHQWDNELPFYHFIGTIIRSAPNVIITSRPQANTFSLDSFDLDLETIGFTKDQVSEYIKNCVKDPDTVAKMEMLIAHKPLIRDLLRIPIQLDAFCYIWHEDTSGISDTSNSITMTILYQSITTELCKKDLKRQDRLKQWQRPSSLEIQYEAKGELALLGEIAFNGLLDNVIEFSPQHWDVMSGHLYSSNAEFSTIFNRLDQLSFLRTSDANSDYMKRTYHFIHLTYQEFFAARHFVEHWQNSKQLKCLRFNGRGKHSITPLTFLHEEKYNPRYNIFWRFVTGLVSQRNGAAELFRQLRAEPIDMIGATHRRLLMYCLSEVDPDQNQELYDIESDLLKQRLILEAGPMQPAYYPIYHFPIELGMEAEFPERILCDCLQDESKIPYKRTLQTIGGRSVVQLKTLEVVADKLAPRFHLMIRLQAAEVLLKNQTICPPSVLEDAITAAITAALEDVNIRDQAVWVLDTQWNLSKRAVDALIAAILGITTLYGLGSVASILKRQLPPEEIMNTIVAALQNSKGDRFAQERAAEALKEFPLSTEVVNALISALKDKDSPIRYFAKEALKNGNLSEETTSTLFTMLQNTEEDSNVRRLAANVLSKQSSSEKVTNFLITALSCEEGGSDMQSDIASILQRMSLSEEAIDALITLLQNKAEKLAVRRYAAQALQKESLPEKAVNALVTALQSEDEDLGDICAIALRKQSQLNEGAVNILATLLGSEDVMLRCFAARALELKSCLTEWVVDALILATEDKNPIVRQPAIQALVGHPCDRAVDALIQILKDKDLISMELAAQVLETQPHLPERAIDALIGALLHEDEFDVREAVSNALETQSCLPEKGIDILVAALKNEDCDIQYFVGKVLKQQISLSDKVVMVLVGMLEKDDEEEIYDILQLHESFFRMIKNLDDQAWLAVWSAWCKQSLHHDISCYELHGCLYLWSDGVRREILTDPARIAHLRRIVFDNPNVESQEGMDSKPSAVIEQDDTQPPKSDTASKSDTARKSDKAPKPKSRAFSRLLRWRK